MAAVGGDIKTRVYNRGRGFDSVCVFYKLSEKPEFASTDEEYFWSLPGSLSATEARTQGCVYDPEGKHTWEVNLFWLRGLIEKKRLVLLYSRFTVKNIWKSGGIPRKPETMGQGVFSAYMKEIATALKAGYKISISEGNEIFLRKMDAEAVDTSRLDPTREEIEGTIKTLIDALFDKIKESFETLHNFLGFIIRKEGFLEDVDEKYWKLFRDVRQREIFGDPVSDNLFKLLSLFSDLEPYIYEQGVPAVLNDFHQLHKEYVQASDLEQKPEVAYAK